MTAMTTCLIILTAALGALGLAAVLLALAGRGWAAIDAALLEIDAERVWLASERRKIDAAQAELVALSEAQVEAAADDLDRIGALMSAETAARGGDVGRMVMR